MTQKKQIKHLIKMANQIAANISVSDNSTESAEKTSLHMKKFWPPIMKRQIIEYMNSDGDELSPVAKQAVGLLRD
jgi:formate dehydrogenase subunit delta